METKQKSDYGINLGYSTFKPYKCLGCGKDILLEENYQYGWICPKCRKTTKLKIPCSVCGKPFEVGFDTYRLKDPNKPWRCRRCNDDYRNAVYQAKSPEEKAEFVAKQTRRTKVYWANKSDKEKEADSKRRKELWKQRRADGTAEQMLAKMQAGRKEWWDHLSEYGKKLKRKRLTEEHDKWWASLTQEQKDAHMKIAHDAVKDKWAAMTPEEREAQMKGIREGCQSWWDNMSRKDFIEWRVELAKKLKEDKDSGVDTGRVEKPEPSEIDFMNLLNIEKLNFIYQYPSTQIHPDFDKLFPINKVTNTENVDPTHLWDFMIKTATGNVFVDVDGSVHSSKSGDAPTLFNDSKRPYQTDGLPAYAIRAYDDVVSDSTEVENIATGEVLTVGALLTLLNFMNNYGEK